MRTEPTEQENRAAIDAIKAEERPTFKLHSARCGMVANNQGYHFWIVKAYNEFGDEITIAEFPMYSGTLYRQMMRFLAEKLTRDINSGLYGG